MTGGFKARHDPELEPAAIRAAHERIPAVLRNGACYVDETLSARLADPVIVKIESTNPVRSYKGRGTWLAVTALKDAARIGAGRPVVVASTGNFGQGVAYAARALSVPAVVFADEAANPVKVERMRRMGATVTLTGRDFDAAREAAAEYVADGRGHLLVDGEDPWVATGAATLALEVTDAVARGDVPLPVAAYVPTGNGALIVGVGAWLRAETPHCRVVGIQAAAAPSMALSWREGRLVETETAETFAEGIATRVPVPEALDMMVGRVDDMILVDEEGLHAAQAELTKALGITVEGAAAASWAGVLADTGRPRGPALVIVTGSNVA